MSKAHINTRTLGASLASRLISEAKHVPSQYIYNYSILVDINDIFIFFRNDIICQ